MGAPQPQAQSSFVLRAGSVLADRYRLVEPVGSGAMGSVWRARHVDLGTSVAIKFLHHDLAETREARARFEREARLSARLAEKCRYIAKVIDYGVVDGMGPFLAMEMLEGEELAQRLKRDKRISLAFVALIVQQVCKALEVAHAEGVVHRDVKPQNVFLARPHTNMTVFAKLMDFGVAKMVQADETEGLTRVGMVVGTPAYMSPEQLLAQGVDPRSDLWSVAALVYRVVTGELPFGTGTLAEMGVRIVTLDHKPPSKLVPSLPPEFDAWMARGLAKEVQNRFQSAQELSDALLEIAGAQQMPFALHPSPHFESGVRLLPTEEPITTRERRALERTASGVRPVQKPWRALVGVVVVLTAVLVGVLAATMLKPAPSSVAALADAFANPTVSASVPAPVLSASATEVATASASVTAAPPPVPAPKKLKWKPKSAK